MNKNRKISNIINVFQYDETTGNVGINGVPVSGYAAYLHTSVSDGSLAIDSSASINALYLLKNGIKNFEISYDTSGTAKIFRLLPYQTGSFFEIGNPSNAGTDYVFISESTYGNVLIGPGIGNGVSNLTGATAATHKIQLNGAVWASSSIQATSFILTGGASTGFLKADGTVDSSTYATQTYVGTQLANLVGSAPAALDTLNELAAALGNDANFATTVTNSIATKLALTGGTLTGDLTLSGTNPRLYFTDTDNNPDYFISNTDGTFTVYDVTNSVGRFKIYTTGSAEFSNNLTAASFIKSGGTSSQFLMADGSVSTNPGWLTGITSGQVTTALGYTPYNSTNPSGYISGITSAMVTTALGFTPYNSTNPSGYVTGTTADSTYLKGTSSPGTPGNFTLSIGNNGTYSYVQSHSSQPLELNPVGNAVRIAGNVVWHQGNLTNLNQLSNGPGYITGITSANVTTALGYTPYNSSNPSGYITSSASITGTSAGVSVTLTGTNAANLLYAAIADNDFARIRVGGDASNAGWMEIATADDGTEPIYVRQYTGVFSSLTRTATLLDGSGNTSFPGTMTIGGYLTVTGAGTSSSIYMSDTDEGQREIHCNSNRIGFLTQAGAWGAWCDDAGNWNAANFSGSSSGTNTGDQTNISGNAATATSAGNVNGNLTSDGWVRTVGDSTQLKFYGNSRTMVYRTDGNTNPHGGGGYAHIFYYGGSADSQRVFIVNTDGRLYSPYHGWLDTMSVGYASSAGSASSATSASYANYLSTNYVGGVQGNPQVYFNNGIGVKVAMTGAWSTWSDTLWINGYSGGDVPYMCALHTLRNGSPRMAISVQSSTSTGYGTMYEFITSYNIASQTVANTNSISSATGGSYTWTAQNQFLTNNGGSAVNNSNSPALQAYSTGNNSAFMSFHRGGYYAVNFGLDNDNYMRIGGWSAAANRFQLNLASGDLTVSGFIRSSQNVYVDNNYGCSVIGVYSASRYQGVWSMGAAYVLPLDGTTPGNLYGLAWSHPNAGGQAGYLSTHGLLIMENGTTNTALANGIWTRGDVTAYSDARVKDNIELITDAVEKVKAIRGVTFTRNDRDDKTKRFAGVIAQEVLPVLPEVVTEDALGTYSVAYGNLNALLIEAIKEQQKEIELLKTLINGLTN